jgi:Flp pilus assembly protein TadD
MNKVITLSLLCAFAATAAQAADTSPPPPPPPPAAKAAAPANPMDAAKAHIANKRWPAAIAELKKANASNNADWNNLMGFALRKQSAPDLDGAQRHYDAALAIEPTHQGALEYSGELALMKGDLATAELRLAALNKLCSTPCEPLDDLKKAVAKFKATGKI